MQTAINGIPVTATTIEAGGDFGAGKLSTVKQQEKIQSTLQIMADKYSRDLLRVTQILPKSALAISQETGIPISTVYRRIQKLQDAGVLRISGEINLEGKKHFLYQSKVKAIASKFAGEFIHIEITPNPSSISQSWGV